MEGLPCFRPLYLCTELHPGSLCHMVNLGALSSSDKRGMKGALVWLAVRLLGRSNAWLISGVALSDRPPAGAPVHLLHGDHTHPGGYPAHCAGLFADPFLEAMDRAS